MSGAPNPPYIRHYDVPLLDDLHNYFPELLYGSLEQFPNVASLLTYVRARVRERFDLFSAGQRAAAGVSTSGPPAAARVTASPSRFSTSPPLNSQRRYAGGTGTTGTGTTGQYSVLEERNRERAREIRAQDAAAAAQEVRAASSLMNLMQDMLNPAPTPLSSLGLLNLALGGGFGGGAIPLQTQISAEFLEPVPVNPTPAQIAAGTVLEPVDAEEEVCAICQDDMPAGSEARALRACDHRFHVGCIDTWFQRDARCPVCRHDIREPVEHAPAAAAPAPDGV